MFKVCLLLGVVALGSVSSGMLLGGVMPVDLSSDSLDETRRDLMEAVHWATEKICDTIKTPVHLKFIQLLHATEQVVAGMKYQLKFKVGETDCLKEMADPSGCKISRQPNHKKYICTATVWSRPWLPNPEHMQLLDHPRCDEDN